MKKIIFTIIVVAILLPFASAGISDWFGRLTGKVTNQPLNLSISVGGGNAPTIITYNTLMTDVSSGLNEGPLSTAVTIKFEATDLEGFGNLNDSSATMAFSKGGETTRSTTCSRVGGEFSGNTANYTCTINMWWWDGAGTWDITADISDINGNNGQDSTKTFTVGATAGFVSAPTSLTWAEINPAAINQEAIQFITLNNTGNMARNVEFNTTNLLGESDNTKGLYANNFSAHTAGGCEGTGMVHSTFTQIVGATMPKGNYSIADGTGQEDIYVCLEAANTDLTQQVYSTAEEGAWTLRIA